MGLLKTFSRYRRSKGFGVHSPFAFRFITEVLTESLPYYDYDRLPSGADRTVYRIAARFNPRHVASLGNADLKPILMACPNAVKTKADACELLVAAAVPDKAALGDAIDRECRIILRDEALGLLPFIKDYLAQKDCGMIFDNCRNLTVIVPDPKLPRQDFEVMF